MTPQKEIMPKRIPGLTTYFWLFLTLIQPTAFAADEAISESIFVNQIGYLLSKPKIAIVSSPVGIPFQVNRIENGLPVLKGMLQLAEAQDPASGTHVWKADFSAIETPGDYELEVPGIGKSYPFRIGRDLYGDLARDALRSFTYLRCGTGLSKEVAGAWAREACHLSDQEVYSATTANTTIQPATGGWHDGSDLGKYTINGISAAFTLLLLQETLPQAFPDGSLNLPERENGVPDILDEVRWELEWILRMQNDDGGIRHKVTPLEPLMEASEASEQAKRFLFPVSTAVTAAGCGLLAKAARLYHPHDATFAVQCQNAAIAAWNYLEEHPNDEGFKNPEGILTKSFTDPDDSDERFCAALELFITTKNRQYFEIAEALAHRRVPLLSASGYWGNAMPIAAAESVLSLTEEVKSNLVRELREDLISMADTFVQKAVMDGFHLTLREGEFSWGSNSVILQNSIILHLAYLVEPREEFLETSMQQLHYILGRNPLSKSYVTGYGKTPPRNPYNPSYQTKDQTKPVPGFLVSGPNQFLNDGVLKRSFTSSSAPATIYADDKESFSSNELSIGLNAALAFIAAQLSYGP